MPSLEVVQVVLVQCTVADIQYQRMFEVLYTFTSNKSYAYLLNVESSNLVIFSNNTVFEKIIITFTYQNGRPFKIKNRVNLLLFIIK